jgi:hypothetical protein
LLSPPPHHDLLVLILNVWLSHSHYLWTFRKIQSVFGLSDGSGLAVTVARYETPAHTDIDKVTIAICQLVVNKRIYMKSEPVLCLETRI